MDTRRGIVRNMLGAVAVALMSGNNSTEALNLKAGDRRFGVIGNGGTSLSLRRNKRRGARYHQRSPEQVAKLKAAAEEKRERKRAFRRNQAWPYIAAGG